MANTQLGMNLFSWAFWLLCFAVARVLSNPNCPIQDAEFPKPRQLSESPVWKAAMRNLSAAFDAVDTSAANYSYSVQIFSTNPGPSILFDRHHTARNLPSNTTGVKTVDANTVYRIGSITKVFTTLAFLAEAGDKHFNRPITDFIPELAAMSQSKDELRSVDWENISIESLMAQMSGLGRDYLLLGEIIGAIGEGRAVEMGFPPLDASQVPECGGNRLCNREQFFKGMKTIYPSFAPWKTPAYSNIGFQLLAYALENITGRNFTASLNDKVLGPLALKNTYYRNPPESVGIIPRNVGQTSWEAYLGDTSPSGNMFASAGDLSTFGLAILNSTILKPALTRRWLKPVSFSSDFAAAVGMPWGLRRLRMGESGNPHRTVTAFTKAGGVGDYSALISILPELNIGMTVMVAGADTAGVIWSIADYLGAVLLPSYEAASRDDANARFSGTYQADPASNLNSTLVLDTDPARPGLGVATWLSNGTNMVPTALALQTGLAVASDPGADNSTAMPTVRLYYTGLQSATASGGVLQSFRGIFQSIGPDTNPGSPGSKFSTDCGTWVDYTSVTYASLPLDAFLFESDVSGNVLSVRNLALNVTMQKVK